MAGFPNDVPIVSFPLSILPGTPLAKQADEFGIETSTLVDDDDDNDNTNNNKKKANIIGKATFDVRSQMQLAVSSNSFTRSDYAEMAEYAASLNSIYDLQTERRDGRFGLHVKNVSTTGSGGASRLLGK